ncbi:1-phosphatidylinositol 4,5-bisphosphate phosphodiesterase delta-1-like [Mobula birostris]|uniref:1-phosphatidylinositol 4,5-bisphosphate phosphodiesterase delta-1-like n=1 Tax=Mobula birostris TaxID=1983395 RepID=UPI003B288D9F
MLKIKSSSWMKSRYYKLNEDCWTVQYNSKKILKSARSQMFSIDDIKELRPGHQTEGMKRYATEILTDRCFTIIFKGTRENLDLVAFDANEAWHWIHGLAKLKQRLQNEQQRAAGPASI